MPLYRSSLFRMNRRLILGSAAVLTTVGIVAGGIQVVPYISTTSIVATSDSDVATIELGAANSSLFDSSVNHAISLDIDQSSIDEMIADYQEDGTKTWVRATITIDGISIPDVGVRLKGNSTLQTLGGSGGFGGAEGAERQMPTGDFAPPGMTENNGEAMEPPAGAIAQPDMTAEDNSTDETTALPEDAVAEPNMADGGRAGGGFGGMRNSALNIDDPSTYPLLISFDKYVEGQVYQGMTQLSLRVGVPSINESTALALTAATGQSTQQYSYVTYSVNDSATTTRLILEYPDESYAAELGDGVLFKADSTSSFTYQGEDQTEYDGQFKQINGTGNGDIQPIINLLSWLESASDEEFAAELGDYVDVESFAKYVATQNLLVNQDDMAGPGKNYYLWYSYETGLISVLSWDLDLSMSGSTDAAPTDSISMGGGMGGGMAGAEQPNENQEMTLPEGVELPEGAERPEGMESMMSGNELKERFLASDAFTEVYLTAYWDLYDQIYGSDTATLILDELASTIPVSESLTQEEIDTAISELRDWINQRTTALATQRTES